MEAGALHTEPYRADLGDLEPLKRAYAQGVPLLEPAAVVMHGKGYSVIGGERRAAAQLTAGARHISLYVVRTWLEYFAWMLLDEQRRADTDALLTTRLDVPMTLVDAAWWVRKVMGNLKASRSEAIERVLAEYVGRPIQYIRDVKYQLRWLEHDDPEVRKFAADQLRYVAQGVTVGSTIGGRITRFAESRSTMPLKQQRAILTSASSQLAGLADALRPLVPTLSTELTDEEIGEALRHLGEGRLQIERVIRALRSIKERRTQ